MGGTRSRAFLAILVVSGLAGIALWWQGSERQHVVDKLGASPVFAVQAADIELTPGQLALRNALRKVYADCEVRLTTDTSGTIQKGPESLPFTLEGGVEFECEGVKRFAVVVVFEKEQQKQYQRINEGRPIAEVYFANRLVLGNFGDPEDVRHVLVDVRAGVSRGHTLFFGDVVGDGACQLTLRAWVLYPAEPQLGQVKTERVYYYAILPDLRLLAAATEMRTWLDNRGHERDTTRRVVSFGVSESGGHVLRVRTAQKGSVREVVQEYGRRETGEFEFVDEPWIVTDEGSVRVGERLSLRLVSDRGVLVVGARVEYEIKEIDFVQQREIWRKGTAHTGESGEVAIDGCRWGVKVNVFMNSHLAFKKFWGRAEVPVDTVVIALEAEEAHPVRMYASDYHRKWSKEEAMVAGMKFPDVGVVESATPGVGNQVASVECDWKSTTGDWGDSVVVIRGLNGWEVSPGPLLVEDGKSMRRAPDGGYQTTLEFIVRNCPQGFYFHNQKERRFGKAWGFKFLDKGGDIRLVPKGSRGIVVTWNLAVQEQGCGSPALNQK